MNTDFEDVYNVYLTGTESTMDDSFSDESLATETPDPQSTKAFVAIWDPSDDVLFLSRPNSTRNSFLTAKHQLYPPELSEINSLNISDTAPSSSRSSSYYYDVSVDHEPIYSPLSSEQRSLRGMTQTSSTLGGLDVYLKGVSLSYTHRHQPVYSVLDFSNEFNFEASVGLGQDPEEVYTARRSGLHLNTCLAKPGFRVDNDSSSLSWSTVESPTAEEIANMRMQPNSVKSRHGRRLKKRRPEDVPPSPVKDFNSTPAASPTTSLTPAPQHCLSLGRPKRIFKGLLAMGSTKRKVDRDWIWVETR